MVYAHKPKFPVRVYANPEKKVACFLSEVPLPGKSHRPLARALLDWAKAQGARRIICLEGLPLAQEASEAEIDVWAVGSIDSANEAIEKAALGYLETGIVSGVAGVLLNEGRWANYEVIALLGEARPYLPDAHAAAKLARTRAGIGPPGGSTSPQGWIRKTTGSDAARATAASAFSTPNAFT